jgi:hypothetical protein
MNKQLSFRENASKGTTFQDLISMISGSQMDDGTWSTVLGTFKKAPSLVGANVVTDIKFDYVAQSTNQFSFIHINKGLLALGMSSVHWEHRGCKRSV